MTGVCDKTALPRSVRESRAAEPVQKRAKAIVEFREARRATRNPVFTSADDLLLIKGIGVATVTKLKPYLVFQPAPATRP